MNTDERRAKVAAQSIKNKYDWKLMDGEAREIARAIRESDEAAGMVLVPMPPADNAVWPADIILDLHHTSMNAAMGRKFYRAMIAAAEESHDP